MNNLQSAVSIEFQCLGSFSSVSEAMPVRLVFSSVAISNLEPVISHSPRLELGQLVDTHH
jgi:hypothetical protein